MARDGWGDPGWLSWRGTAGAIGRTAELAWDGWGDPGGRLSWRGWAMGRAAEAIRRVEESRVAVQHAGTGDSITLDEK